MLVDVPSHIQQRRCVVCNTKLHVYGPSARKNAMVRHFRDKHGLNALCTREYEPARIE